jgi:hypothetical protein
VVAPLDETVRTTMPLVLLLTVDARVMDVAVDNVVVGLNLFFFL